MARTSFGFAQTIHIVGNGIERTVYGPVFTGLHYIEINHLHMHRAHKSQNCVRVVLRVKYLQLLVLKITATSLQIT